MQLDELQDKSGVFEDDIRTLSKKVKKQPQLTSDFENVTRETEILAKIEFMRGDIKELKEGVSSQRNTELVKQKREDIRKSYLVEDNDTDGSNRELIPPPTKLTSPNDRKFKMKELDEIQAFIQQFVNEAAVNCIYLVQSNLISTREKYTNVDWMLRNAEFVSKK